MFVLIRTFVEESGPTDMNRKSDFFEDSHVMPEKMECVITIPFWERLLCIKVGVLKTSERLKCYFEHV